MKGYGCLERQIRPPPRGWAGSLPPQIRLLLLMYLVDNTVLLGVVCRHIKVTLHIFFYLSDWLAGVLGEYSIKVLARLDDVLGGDLDIRSLALHAAPGLVNHHFGIRERKAFALLSRRENDARGGGRDADTDRRDIWFDVIHRVEDGEASSNRASRRINVDVDIFLGVFRFKKEKLRDDQVRGIVINGSAQKDNTVFQ